MHEQVSHKSPLSHVICGPEIGLMSLFSVCQLLVCCCYGNAFMKISSAARQTNQTNQTNLFTQFLSGNPAAASLAAMFDPSQYQQYQSSFSNV